MKLIGLLAYVIIMLGSINGAYGQGFVSIKRGTMISARPGTLWDFTIENTTKKTFQVYCKGKISENRRGVIYDVMTRSFEILSDKDTHINSATIIVESIKTDKIGQRYTLPSGTYNLMIEIYSVGENTLLSNSQTIISVDEAGGVYEGVLPFQSKGNKLISTNGSVRATYEYNPVNSIYVQYNNNQYARLEATPSVVIKGIPISSNILLSTERYTQTSLNQIDIHFDYYRYKEYLQQLVLEKIKVLEQNGNIEKVKDIAHSYIREKYPELDKIKEKLNDEKFKNIEETIKSYENSQSLTTVLNQNADFQKYKGMAQQYAVSSMDTLEKLKSRFSDYDYHQLEWYLTVEKAYAEAKEKAESFSKYQKLYKEYQKLNGKLKEVENINYQEILNDPKSLEKYLDRFEGISKAMKWASSIRNFSTGSSYPQMSDLTLTGMRTNGLNIEINKKNLYAAVTNGKIDAANYFGLPIGGLNRNLNAVRLGYGKVESSHLFFNYLKIRDNNTRIDSISSKPQDNLVVGVEGQWSLFKDRLIIKTEIAQAYHTYDRMLIDSSYTEGGASDWVGQVSSFKSNSSSHKDRAFNAEIYGQSNDGLTTLSGYYKYVGAGYVSLGVPFLMKNVKRYEGRLTHQIFQRKISVSAFVRNDVDNVLLNRAFTNVNSSFGVELGLNFKKLPSIRIAFAPTKQSALKNNDNGFAIPDSAFDFKANTNMLFLSLTHQYKLGDVFATTQVSGTEFLGRSKEQNYNTYNINLQQNFQFGRAGGLNTFLTQYRQRLLQRSGNTTETGMYTGGEGYIKMGKYFNSTCGFNYAISKTYPERYLTYAELGRSFFKNSSTLRLRVSYAKQGKIENKDFYNSVNSGLGIRSVLTVNW